jgi:hypothetical protein
VDAVGRRNCSWRGSDRAGSARELAATGADTGVVVAAKRAPLASYFSKIFK